MLPPEILEAFASFDEKYPFHFVLNLLLPPENLEAFQMLPPENLEAFQMLPPENLEAFANQRWSLQVE